MWPSSSTVVVLPFVPVTATNSLGSSRQPSSTSPSTGTPRARAAATTAASRGTPGDFTTARACGRYASPSVPRWASMPSGTSGLPPSTPTTRSPRASSARAAAIPDRASPTTSQGPAGSGGRKRSDNGLLVQREADRAADRRDDPEAQDDLRLRPRHELEMVVDRRHQEDPLAE